MILTSCRDQGKVVEFNDRIFTTRTDAKWVVALGGKGMWVLWGRYKGSKFDGKAGTVLLVTGEKARFRIKSLVSKYPVADVRVQKAIEEQEKTWKEE